MKKSERGREVEEERKDKVKKGQRRSRRRGAGRERVGELEASSASVAHSREESPVRRSKEENKGLLGAAGPCLACKPTSVLGIGRTRANQRTRGEAALRDYSDVAFGVFTRSLRDGSRMRESPWGESCLVFYVAEERTPRRWASG